MRSYRARFCTRHANASSAYTVQTRLSFDKLYGLILFLYVLLQLRRVTMVPGLPYTVTRLPSSLNVGGGMLMVQLNTCKHKLNVLRYLNVGGGMLMVQLNTCIYKLNVLRYLRMKQRISTYIAGF